MPTTRRSFGLARAQGSRAGSALVMAVILLGTLVVLSTTFLRLGLGVSKQHNSSLDDTRAFYVAEAGIAEAGAAIIAGKSGNVGTAAAPPSFGHGGVWGAATEPRGGDYPL